MRLRSHARLLFWNEKPIVPFTGEQPLRSEPTLADFLAAAICVPVCNEAAELPGFLEAVAELNRPRLNVSLNIFFDGCTDASEEIVAACSPVTVVSRSGPVQACSNAGRARRAAMAIGLTTLRPHRRAVLLSTDADSRPNTDWLLAAVAALEHADIAAGRIVGESAGGLQRRVEAYYDELHTLRRRLDPVDWDDVAHYHHRGGANLAFRRAAYQAIGGFQPVPAAEDARLLDDAERAGLRVRHDPSMIVKTSSRRDGRADGGLASALVWLDRHGPPKVAPPSAAIWQYERHRLARLAYAHIADARARTAFGATIGLSGDHVLGVARDCPNATAFAMRIVPSAPNGAEQMPLAEAEAQLGVLQCRNFERAA